MKRVWLYAKTSTPPSIFGGIAEQAFLLVEDYHEYAQPLIKRLFLEESQCVDDSFPLLYAVAV